jgi:hypothetical protein
MINHIDQSAGFEDDRRICKGSCPHSLTFIQYLYLCDRFKDKKTNGPVVQWIE